MRLTSTAFMLFVISTVSVSAYDKNNGQTAAKYKTGADKIKPLNELEELLLSGKIIVKIKPKKSDTWQRWAQAVCIGCNIQPNEMTTVHTYPYRVLAGVLASDDDDRERRGYSIR